MSELDHTKVVYNHEIRVGDEMLMPDHRTWLTVTEIWPVKEGRIFMHLSGDGLAHLDKDDMVPIRRRPTADEPHGPTPPGYVNGNDLLEWLRWGCLGAKKSGRSRHASPGEIAFAIEGGAIERWPKDYADMRWEEA